MTTQTTEFTADRVKHVFTGDQVQWFMRHLRDRRGETLVFDLETTGLNEWLPSSRISVATFTFDEDQNWCVPLSHPYSPWANSWKRLYGRIAEEMTHHMWVGQNVSFDVRWTHATTGVDLSDRVATDTMLGFHLLDDQQTTSLKPRASKVFGIPQWNDFDFKQIEKEQEKDPRYPNCPLMSERVPYFQLATYATADTYWTWRSLKYQRALLDLEPEVRHSLENDRDITEYDREYLRMGRYKEAIGDHAVGSLTKMSINGMKANREWCENRLERNEEVIAEREQELVDMLDPFATPHYRDDAVSFNPNSGWFKDWAQEMVCAKKLREVGVTEKGDVSWDASCLKRNARLGMVAAEPLMDLRTRTTENQFLRVWLRDSTIDGRIHANFNFARTRTGRLSSSDPNLQQVSRVMKNAFQAEDGNVLVTADYSMVELRIAAWLANVKPIKEALWEGIDLHKLTAANTARIDLSEVTKELRQMAKAVNFGLIFGMGAPKLVTYAEDNYEVFMTPEEAVNARQAFFETWEGLADWHDQRRSEVHLTGQVVCPLGRIRRLPDGMSKNKYWRGQAERQAINTPVQSTASDMMLVAINEITKVDWIKCLAPVHDAIITEVPEHRAAEAAQIVKDTMENFVPAYLEKTLGVRLTVPLVADTSYGKNWGEQSELAS